MRKILLIILCLAVALGSNAQKDKQNTKDMKTIVTYFSCTQNTKRAAEKLAKEMKADLWEIAPAVPYSDADLNWQDKQSRSSVEMTDKSSRPAIKDTLSNIAEYSVVYIGFPIWWYTAPTIINTFIEAHDLACKEIHLFATSGGSNADKALKELKAAYPQYNFVDAKLMK